MEVKFGKMYLKPVYRVHLRSRIQRPNETLQEFEADVTHLAQLGYHRTTYEILEQLATEPFMKGIQNSELKLKVRCFRPKASAKALAFALKYNAINLPVRSYIKVRRVEDATAMKSSTRQIKKDDLKIFAHSAGDVEK